MDVNYDKHNRIGEALSIRNMKQVELCEKTGISKGALNNWIKQRWQPKQTAIYKMAKALDVSEMWLAGYDTAMERPTSQKKMDSLAETIQLLKDNERYYNLVSTIVQLDDEQFTLIETMANQLKIKK